MRSLALHVRPATLQRRRARALASPSPHVRPSPRPPRAPRSLTEFGRRWASRPVGRRQSSPPTPARRQLLSVVGASPAPEPACGPAPPATAAESQKGDPQCPRYEPPPSLRLQSSGRRRAFVENAASEKMSARVDASRRVLFRRHVHGRAITFPAGSLASHPAPARIRSRVACLAQVPPRARTDSTGRGRTASGHLFVGAFSTNARPANPARLQPSEGGGFIPGHVDLPFSRFAAVAGVLDGMLALEPAKRPTRWELSSSWRVQGLRRPDRTRAHASARALSRTRSAWRPGDGFDMREGSRGAAGGAARVLATWSASRAAWPMAR